MSLGGWLVMLFSVGGVTALFSWCLWKVLTTKGESEHIHGFEVEPPDVVEESGGVKRRRRRRNRD